MVKSLRIGFMGTPEFAKVALEALAGTGHEIVCVYSQPPRPKGRGHKMALSPVHEYAQEQGFEVFHPLNFKDQADVDVFKGHDLDVAIVAAYGLILPQQILDAPRFGCINIHASLLPRWRGAAPIQRAIWAGDTKSGICLMEMELGLDTGPVIATGEVPITSATTASDLHDDLAVMGGEMVVACVDEMAAKGGKLPSAAQDDAASTYAHMLRKEHGLIDWSLDAAALDRQIRALNPWPATWCHHGGKRLKILAADIVQHGGAAKAGEIVDKTGVIGCGSGTTLRITKLQLEGKKPMDFAAAYNGGLINVGDVLS